MMTHSDYPTDPADILEAAADLLETNGWIQGEFEFNGKFCAVGAIRQVSGLYQSAVALQELGRTNMYNRDSTDYDICTSTSSAAESALSDSLGSQAVDGGLVYVPSWNDEPGRTADEVIDLMKHTAKDLRNRKEPA
jgi:hypothetical protein